VVGNTAGQDLNLNLDKLAANRNFINKLWNGGKFILFNLSEVEQEELDQLAVITFSQVS
jgi:valyl-tRNA synthetase